jgi:hypothetical protein
MDKLLQIFFGNLQLQISLYPTTMSQLISSKLTSNNPNATQTHLKHNSDVIHQATSINHHEYLIHSPPLINNNNNRSTGRVVLRDAGSSTMNPGSPLISVPSR